MGTNLAWFIPECLRGKPLRVPGAYGWGLDFRSPPVWFFDLLTVISRRLETLALVQPGQHWQWRRWSDEPQE